MDFTPELSAFQGVLLSADNVHPFSNVTSKGGNQLEIKFVVDSTLNFLQKNNFYNNGIVEEFSATYRKFALYIVLNTDLHILAELVHIEEIDLVVWTIPILSKCLMCELLLNLHMENFLYEIATFCFPPLALEIAESFIEHFKYLSANDYLEQLKRLSVACYTVICRFNFYEFGQNKFSIYLTNAFTNFEKYIKYFLDPSNKDKLNTVCEDEIYKQQGKCLYAALCCLHECIIQFTSRQERKPKEIDNIYVLTYPKESVKEDCSSYNVGDNPKEILEVLNNCHNVLLDAVQILIMDVSVEIYCAWNEFELSERTMQEAIGELCYKLHTKLIEIPSICDHILITMIKRIAIKPVDVKDLINSLDVVSIIDNINKNNDEKQKWLPALIYKDQLYKHIELLQVIDINLASYSHEECYKLYRILRSSPENKELTEPLSIKVFQCCEITDKYKILNDNFYKNCFVDMPETPEFILMLTEVFNKLVVSPDADFADVLTLFLQNPHKVYVKIFSLAIENSHQAEIMLRVMKLLEKFSNHYYETDTESCIIKVTQITIDLLESEAKQNHFVKFIHGLKETNVIPGSKLLLLIIMPNVHKSLLSRNITNINIQIKLLRDVYHLEEIIDYRAPMLAMLAQVLDVVRWKIHTFTPVAPNTLQLVLLLQKSLITTYTDNCIPENESSWLKNKLKNLQPLNMYYYRCLWNPPGDNFLEVISGKKINKETRLEVIRTFLAQILCSCTQQEWCDIWDSLTDFNDTLKLHMFHQAMAVVAIAERTNRTYNSWMCLLYCYRNLIYIMRYKFFKEPLSDEQVTLVVKTIVATPILKKGKADEVEPLLLPLFSYLAERKSDYTVDLSTCTQLRHNNFVNLINKVFASDSK